MRPVILRSIFEVLARVVQWLLTQAGNRKDAAAVKMRQAKYTLRFCCAITVPVVTFCNKPRRGAAKTFQ
jgi:hypothetical protein